MFMAVRRTCDGYWTIFIFLTCVQLFLFFLSFYLSACACRLCFHVSRLALRLLTSNKLELSWVELSWDTLVGPDAVYATLILALSMWVYRLVWHWQVAYISFHCFLFTYLFYVTSYESWKLNPAVAFVWVAFLHWNSTSEMHTISRSKFPNFLGRGYHSHSGNTPSPHPRRFVQLIFSHYFKAFNLSY